MLTSIFHHNSEYIGINIERVDKEFIVCLAYITNAKWNAKTLSGISRDLSGEKLCKKIIEDGFDLDEQEANKIFSNTVRLKLEYSSTKK